jgi:magnesium-transporting ATPase (P-type)
MNESELQVAATETDIFARVSPEHKLRLVKALQAHDLTVAMTGDGVNDAPALKRADAGVAMGQKGSAAAKEAAEVVLADDNFASIAAAVRQGRTVHDNLKKVITWTLPTNAGEAMLIIVALVFGLALPISPIQILWVNLITATTLGMALAFEPTENTTMQRPPRHRNAPLLNGTMIWQIVLVSVLFLGGVFGVYTYALDQGYPIELCRTLAVNTLVLLEVAYLFFIRNLYTSSLSWSALKATKAVWITVSIVLLAQATFTYWSVMQSIFGTQAVSAKDVLVTLSVALVIFLIIEVEKQARMVFMPKALS